VHGDASAQRRVRIAAARGANGADLRGGVAAVAMHRVAQGLDVPLAGDPEAVVDAAAQTATVALVAADYPGLKPTMLVQPGQRVLRGQPLFEDKKAPGVRFTAPASGTVAAIHRGDMRAFLSLVIDVAADDGPASQVAFSCYRPGPLEALDADGVRALLVESGLWTAFRTRPFSKVPSPATAPHAIFVTAVDTHPHAAPIDRVLAGREADFDAGVRGVAMLCAGRTYVCKAAGSAVTAPTAERISLEEFAGPHPAGTPGLHIHRLDPVHADKTVWHLGYQDVIAIGRLLSTGILDVERTVSLAGPGALRPRLLRTRLGASTDALTRGELKPGAQRVISGSVLGGRTAQGDVHGYLGRYHQQLAVVPEGGRRELFGYLAPGADKFSIWGVVLGHWAKARRLALTTTTNGSPRAMVPIGAYERVMPMDLMPTFLLRALITRNIEWAEELGVLELDEEDLALCTFVCPGKVEYGPLLREMLSRIEKEHAHG
jgi:Na+-transporting NADH:ubiquinone oxidoreductase subunit A